MLWSGPSRARGLRRPPKRFETRPTDACVSSGVSGEIYAGGAGGADGAIWAMWAPQVMPSFDVWTGAACWERKHLVAEDVLLFIIDQLDVVAPALHRTRNQLLRVKPECIPAFRGGGCKKGRYICDGDETVVPHVQRPTYQSAVCAQYQCGELGLSSFASSWVPPVPGSSTMGESVAMLPVREGRWRCSSAVAGRCGGEVVAE